MFFRTGLVFMFYSVFFSLGLKRSRLFACSSSSTRIWQSEHMAMSAETAAIRSTTDGEALVINTEMRSFFSSCRPQTGQVSRSDIVYLFSGYRRPLHNCQYPHHSGVQAHESGAHGGNTPKLICFAISLISPSKWSTDSWLKVWRITRRFVA